MEETILVGLLAGLPGFLPGLSFEFITIFPLLSLLVRIGTLYMSNLIQEESPYHSGKHVDSALQLPLESCWWR